MVYNMLFIAIAIWSDSQTLQISGLNKIVDILQTQFSNMFTWMNVIEFYTHVTQLSLKVQFTIEYFGLG